LQAMALHPRERPADVAEWQAVLAGLAAPSRHMDLTSPLAAPAAFEWGAILRDNLWLIGVALVLLALALAMTFGGISPP
jgi:hypothetical protein